MSAAKRRIKRKIKMLVRMDRTEWMMRDERPRARADAFYYGCMVPRHRWIISHGGESRMIAALIADRDTRKGSKP